MTILFLFLSTLGFIDSAFLTYQHYSRDPLSCPIFGGCEQVTSSIYSEIYGIPVALLGMFYYGAVFLLTFATFITENKKYLRLSAQLTVLGLLTSVVLLYLQLYVIGAICFYCALSTVSSTLLFAFGVRYLRRLKTFETKFIFNYFAKFSVKEKILGILRLTLGFIFFWSYVDHSPLWLTGGSPAEGFLANGTSGIFADFFAQGATDPVTNFLYMFGLLAVGLALTLGITKRLATLGGVLMMLFIYSAALPPANNPLFDYHIVYILVLLLLFIEDKSYSVFGIYDFWQSLSLVKKYKILK